MRYLRTFRSTSVVSDSGLTGHMDYHTLNFHKAPVRKYYEQHHFHTKNKEEK
jgi:hypothetical protein